MRLDGRKLGAETQEYIRKAAVRLVREGEPVRGVAAHFGLCRTSFYPWLREATEAGLRALNNRPRGGSLPKLSAQQATQLRRLMDRHDPRDYGFASALWTRAIVQELIRERFGVELDVTTVGRTLHRLGLTAQKPLRRAYERNPRKVGYWLHKTLPRLRGRARELGRELFYCDETGIRSDSAAGISWGRRGRRPVIRVPGQRQSINVVSFISPTGAFWFTTYEGKLNARTFCLALMAFLMSWNHPVLLIVDRHPAHVAKQTRTFIRKFLRDHVELHLLPSYAPDLNPDERVNAYLKTNGPAKVPLREGESIRNHVEADLRGLREHPEILCAFFSGEL